ncbi:MAG: YtxH domain-containing protein [Cyanobacteria bacterium]|nr:YtxH domain-containing protein [Cyanobacteriota bacterium]
MANDRDDGVYAFLLGVLIGAATGGVCALLFAPKKGDEFREDAKVFLKALPEKMNEDIQNPQGKTRQFIDKTRATLETKMDEVSYSRQASKVAEAKRREEMASGVELN